MRPLSVPPPLHLHLPSTLQGTLCGVKWRNLEGEGEEEGEEGERGERGEEGERGKGGERGEMGEKGGEGSVRKVRGKMVVKNEGKGVYAIG